MEKVKYLSEELLVDNNGILTKKLITALKKLI